jgi:hypothetical protein
MLDFRGKIALRFAGEDVFIQLLGKKIAVAESDDRFEIPEKLFVFEAGIKIEDLRSFDILSRDAAVRCQPAVPVTNLILSIQNHQTDIDHVEDLLQNHADFLFGIPTAPMNSKTLEIADTMPSVWSKGENDLMFEAECLNCHIASRRISAIVSRE